MGLAVKERRRLALLDLGCICCGRPAEIHHIVNQSYRDETRGDLMTIPFCPWHHRGVPDWGRGKKEMAMIYGPSLAEEKRRFVELYGTEDDLLAKVNEQIGAKS